MQNVEISRYLSGIAGMLELTGDDFFHVRAYRNAARAVLDYAGDFQKLTIQQMEKVPGIGKGTAAKIDELIRTGDISLHRELRAKIPSGVMDLLKLPALGPKRVQQLHEQLRVNNLDDLRNALE